VRPVAAWCLSRGFLPRRDRALPAGVLPDVYPWPAFWPRSHAPFRLVVPMCDARGVVRSMHGRLPSSDQRDLGRGKTRWPAERRCSRLLFASPSARRFLRGEGPDPRLVFIAEGVTSFLAATSHAPDDVVVLAADNGGFPALADTVLPRLRVPVIAAPDCHDPDGTGDRYWREIRRAIPRARRLDLPGRMDVADLLHPRAMCSFDDLMAMTP
jgi:hypothetical protein